MRPRLLALAALIGVIWSVSPLSHARRCLLMCVIAAVLIVRGRCKDRVIAPPARRADYEFQVEKVIEGDVGDPKR